MNSEIIGLRRALSHRWLLSHDFQDGPIPTSPRIALQVVKAR